VSRCTCCDHTAPLAEPPEGQRVPCAWCGAPATHVHVHRVLGGACAHFACRVHADEEDGEHVVHVLKHVSPPPGQQSATSPGGVT